MWEFLVGRKTYILAGLGAATTFAYSMDWIDRGTWETLLGLFVSGSVATLRAAVKKAEP